MVWSRRKKLICTNSVALRKMWAIYKRVKTPLSAACLTFVRRSQHAFRKSRASMFLTCKWSLFFSWSIFDASQLPAYTACFKLPKKHSTGRSWGTFGGSEVFKPSRLLCSWRSFEHLLPLFQDWGGYMALLPHAKCHAFLPEGLSVGNSWNTTCSWDLNQASCSWPPSGDLTRHLRACAGGLGHIVPDPAFLFVVFLSSNDWRKWVNSAFRKTTLFKNCRSERLSLLFISNIEIYNPLSALLLTLVGHFYHVLLRVAIFVLNVAIATHF